MSVGPCTKDWRMAGECLGIHAPRVQHTSLVLPNVRRIFTRFRQVSFHYTFALNLPVDSRIGRSVVQCKHKPPVRHWPLAEVMFQGVLSQ